MPRTTIDMRHDHVYFKALGRFCHEFAMIEAVMFNTLAFYAKVPNQMGREVFSGERLRAATGKIKRIIQFQDPGEDNKNDLDNIFLTT